MTSLRESILQRFTRFEPLPAGIFHYKAPADDPLNYRLHLRLEAGGNGILIINASTILHLNNTAAEYAYHIVKRTPDEQVAKKMSARYRVSKNQALQDFNKLKEQIQTLITTIDLDPVTFFGFERHTPYSDEISAPYRLDCALTYQLPNEADLRFVPAKNVERELTTVEWKSIIDTAWTAGIPHIVFTGGEPTLREDLSELIEYAESHGQVTGLLTDGLKLSDTTYLNELLQSGLDHVMIILHPDDNQSWEALANFSYWAEVLNEDIFVAAHLTLTPENANQAIRLLDKLTEAGVSAVSLSANDKSLNELLQDARSYADDLDLELVWDLPVPYSSVNPVALELEEEDSEDISVRGQHNQGWLYVEPDGDVLHNQGGESVLGNLLSDEWGKIWEKVTGN